MLAASPIVRLTDVKREPINHSSRVRAFGGCRIAGQRHDACARQSRADGARVHRDERARAATGRLREVKRARATRPHRRRRRFYDGRMTTTPSWTATLAELRGQALGWAAGWWQIVHAGALILVLALSPSSYAGDNRAAVARHVYLGTAPVLLWFTVLSSLISLVIVRIVIATAVSYGLSQYAVEMLVRVLVLELIPLTAAVFVALYCALPGATEVAALRSRGGFDELARAGIDPLQREVLPRVLGALFAVLMLATVASVVSAVLAYLSIYGFTVSALPGYTRVFGHVFGPAVSTIFALKSALFGLAVALIPVTSALHDHRRGRLRTSEELRSLVRLFVVILLIEAASLVGNYY